MGSAITLTMRSKAARPQGYKEKKWLAGSYATRTMRFGGVVLLAFIVFHLAQFTVAGVGVEGFRHCEWVGNEFTCYAYQNFVSGFQNPAIVGFYVVAQAFLGMHLAHGVWSMLPACRTHAMTLAARPPRCSGGDLRNAIMPVAVSPGSLPETLLPRLHRSDRP